MKFVSTHPILLIPNSLYIILSIMSFQLPHRKYTPILKNKLPSQKLVQTLNLPSRLSLRLCMSMLLLWHGAAHKFIKLLLLYQDGMDSISQFFILSFVILCILRQVSTNFKTRLSSFARFRNHHFTQSPHISWSMPKNLFEDYYNYLLHSLLGFHCL